MTPTVTVTPTATPGAGADLSIQKAASPPTVELGGELSYELSIQNSGPDTATGVSVSDPLPAGVTLISATASQGTCSGTTTVICALGTISVGGSATITIVVRVDAAGALVNSAVVSGDESDPNPSNDTSTIVTGAGVSTIPVLSFWGFIALAAGLALAGWTFLRQ